MNKKIEDYVLDKGLKNKELNIPYDYLLKSTAIQLYKSYEDKRFLCPVCKQVLIAARGKVKAHHFKHHSTKDEEKCESLTSNTEIMEKIKNNINESEIHKKIKKFFYQYQKTRHIISIPHYEISLSDFNNLNNFEVIPFFDKKDNRYHLEKEKIIPKRNVYILDISEEVRQKNEASNFVIIPDLVIKCKDINNDEIIIYNIEIMITHGVDYQKIEKIKKNKLNCIQIDGNKWFNIKNSLELDKISTYIFTVEKNLEQIYSDLYKIYKEKTDKYNNQYILDKDLQYIAFDQNAFYIKNNEGFCFNCYKELKYDNKYLIYRHKKYLDFYLCNKNPKLSLNFEILNFIQKRGIQYFIKGSQFFLNNNSLTIFNEYYSLDIRPEQINILKLIEIIKNEYIVNFIDILNLTAEQNNLINNSNLFDAFLSNLYNKELILDSIKIKCPFCQEEKGEHKYNCSFFHNDFQKKIEYKVNNILINKISLADEYLEKENFTNLNIISKIIDFLNNAGLNINQNNFYTLKINSDILGVYIKIDEYQEDQLLFTIHFHNHLNNDNIIPYQYIDSCHIIIDYNILTKTNNIDFYDIKINNSDEIFSNNLRNIMNTFLINNSTYVKRFKEIFATHNLIQSKDIRCFKYVNELNHYKYSTNKDGKSLFEVYINKKMKKSDYPAIFIDYTYDNNNFYIKECCDFNLENIFHLLNICFRYHWLIGEKFLLKNKKYIKSIAINQKNLYDIIIGEVKHTLYLHDNNLDYNRYSLSIDVSNIKNIDDFNYLLDNPRKYIKYNTYSSERNIFYTNKILKLKEDKFNKRKEKNDIKANKKEQKNNYLIDTFSGNNTVRNFLNNNNNSIDNLKIFITNRIREQFFDKKIKIFSISPFFKNMSSFSKSDMYSHYKLNTNKESLLVISKFSDKLSIEDNFSIFILKIILSGKEINNIITNKIKYILFFNEYSVKFEDKKYYIDFSKKITLNNFVINNHFYDINKELFFAYFIKNKNYNQIKQLKRNEILSLKKFDFLTENDINIAMQKIK